MDEIIIEKTKGELAEINLELNQNTLITSLKKLEVTPSAQEQVFKAEARAFGEVKIKGDENLIKENIKAGKSIFGVQGDENVVDTSNVTATAEDICYPLTAYANGEKIQGTISTTYGGDSTGYRTYEGSYDGKDLTFIKEFESPQCFKQNGKITIKLDNSRIAKLIDLSADKIAEGSTVLGIDGIHEGLITSDATAVAEDLASGKTAYVNGKRITGTVEKVNDLTNSADRWVIGSQKTTFMFSVDSPIMLNSDSWINLSLANSNLAKSAGLTSDKLLEGNTVLGVEGAVKFPKITNAYELFVSNARIDYLYELLNLCENVTSTANMFASASSLREVDLSKFDTSQVTTMAGMFKACTGLTELNLNSFDTSNTTTMYEMFTNCYKLTNLSIDNFNTSKVTNMDSMFNTCKLLTALNLKHFNTSKVTTMHSMFRNCYAITELDLSNFNTSNVKEMVSMFASCKALTKLNLSSFNTANVTQMTNFLYGCSGLVEVDLSNFNLEKSKDNRDFFAMCSALENVRSFYNLGKGYTQKTTNYTNYWFSVEAAKKLTHDSLIDIITNGLYDLNLTYDVANGGTLYTQSFRLGETNLAKLTADEIAIATNKGWTVS